MCIHVLQTSGVPSEESGVFHLSQLSTCLDFSAVSVSQLSKLAGCLVDTLLVLTDRHNEETEEVLPVTCLPSESECSLLFMTLCIHGIPKFHARACALLLRLCGSQPWWGRFICSAITELFAGSQTAIFNKDR